MYPLPLHIWHFRVESTTSTFPFPSQTIHFSFWCLPVPSQYLHVTIPGTLGALFTSASDILNHITINLKLGYKYFLLIFVSQKNRESRHLAYLTNCLLCRDNECSLSSAAVPFSECCFAECGSWICEVKVDQFICEACLD
jgi:hypothetical protein